MFGLSRVEYASSRGRGGWYFLMHCTLDCVSEGVKACSILSMPTRLWGWRVNVEASLNKAKSVGVKVSK